MDPRRLLTFRAVVRAGSITAGARALGWTQPAISQQLAKLEREAGTPLLLRGPTGVQPTEAGVAVLRQADAVERAVRSARDQVDTLVGLRQGTVRVAAFPSAAADVLPDVGARLRRRGVGVQLRVVAAEPPEATAMLRANEVQLALAYRPPGHSDPRDDLVWRPLFADPVRIVVAADHPLTAGPPTLRDLAGRPWATGRERYRAYLLEVCAAAGFVPDIAHVTDDNVVIQSLVAHGDAVALLPDMALRTVTQAGVRVHAEASLQPWAIGVLHRPAAAYVPAVAAALDALVRVGQARDAAGLAAR